MLRFFRIFCLGWISFFAWNPAFSSPITDAVDPLIGTARSLTGVAKTLTDSGLTQPGPRLPFGMISWGPDTVSDQDESIHDKYERDIGYHYYSHRISGFSLTHLSGAGCPNGGELPILPFVGEPKASPLAFTHEQESATPGDYRVELENNTRVELTSKMRTGFGRFTFKKLKQGVPYGIQFFPEKRANPPAKNENIHPAILHFQDDRHLSGSVVGGDFCQSTNTYRLYFAGELSRGGGKVEINPRLGRVVYRAEQNSVEQVELKIAISYVSEEGALANLRAEEKNERNQPESFESVRLEALLAWERALGKIKIETNDLHKRRVFYTALYHALQSPNVADDVTGQYRGYDDRIHGLPAGHHEYANFSGWDIYRSEVQLLAILFPEVAGDMAQSLVSAADECGALPNWALNHADTAVMIGDSGPILLSDFYAFGVNAFDFRKAFHYMLKNASDPRSACNGHPSRSALAAYLKKGYVSPDDTDFGFTTMSLEYAMSDFAIASFAQGLHETSIADAFLKRSESWKKLWWTPDEPKNPGYIRTKTSDGKWLKPFFPDTNPTMRDPNDPEWMFDQGFVEGTSAQYSLMIPFDFSGLLAKMGNETQVLDRLHRFFSNVSGGMNAPTMHIGNEPCFTAPWIYLWAGHPEGTQEVVHRILETTFNDTPRGLPGNDDLGSMSSWYVFASLGLYPVVPGVGGFAVHSPYFSKARIHLDSGAVIEVIGEGQGPYVNSFSIDSLPVNQTWLTWDQLKKGAQLYFQLSTQPALWGRNSLPPSFHSFL